MSHGKHFLFVSGPSNVPNRTSAFPELTTSLLSDLKQLFRTDQGQCFIFPSSGTGGWEAALGNTLSPGDRVLAPRCGMFGHRWSQLAERLGFPVDVLDEPWGDAGWEMATRDVGIQDPAGSGAATAMEYYRTSAPAT